MITSQYPISVPDEQRIVKEIKIGGFSIHGKFIYFEGSQGIIGYEIGALENSIKFLKKKIKEKYC